MKNEIKRMRYFNGLTLMAKDYKLDKELHTRLQRLHNRYLHTWGIAHGLEVKSDIDNSMGVYVTEGIALDLVEVKDSEGKVIETFSRQILIYNGHPDNPIDLSKYSTGDNIYITVSYKEMLADQNTERGQGEEIHIWERGSIKHTNLKEKIGRDEIILARVVPRLPIKVDTTLNKKSVSNSDENIEDNDPIIDSTCIFDTDVDGSPLRVYAGPYAKVVELEEFIFKLREDSKLTSSLTSSINEKNKISFDVKSLSTTFTGSTNVMGNMILKKSFICKSTKKGGKDFNIEEKFLKLNKKKDVGWEIGDGGLEVYRGGTNVSPDARVIWSEATGIWKIGIGNDLFNIGAGFSWDKLTNSKMVDNEHNHRGLYFKKGTAAYFEDNGELSINGELAIQDNDVILGKDNVCGGIGWFGGKKLFNKANVMKPIIYGNGGGILGTTSDEEKSVLLWNSLGNVGIGSIFPKEDMLEVSGGICLLEDTNPIKFTSSWTGFPDSTINKAEISNDTGIYKELMLVGNQSSGQGRKVTVFDRLDVNGFLYTNGSAEVKKSIIPSSGSLNNGIIFQADPGGGWGDRAWVKYYPIYGEACTLEIGTSNDGDDNISFIHSGNVGIGTFSPKDRLEVFGGIRVMSGRNPIKFTSNYNGFSDLSFKNAEISNDTRKHTSLMLLGNKSGGKGRKVSIWDTLDVKGSLNVCGNFEVNGAIVPVVGNEDSKGIIFPKNPGGGSDDVAWIRYFSDSKRGSGENMTLEIGIANDSNEEDIIDRYWKSYCSWCSSPNNNRYGCGHWEYVTRKIHGNKGDRLRLFASGGVYIEGGFYYTSSRDYKDNITKLCSDSIKNVFDQLEPVEFNFKGDRRKRTIGFIAEDVPDMFTAYDKKAINPLEIITVLVSEVKEQQNRLNQLNKKIENFKNKK